MANLSLSAQPSYISTKPILEPPCADRQVAKRRELSVPLTDALALLDAHIDRERIARKHDAVDRERFEDLTVLTNRSPVEEQERHRLYLLRARRERTIRLILAETAHSVERARSFWSKDRTAFSPTGMQCSREGPGMFGT